NRRHTGGNRIHRARLSQHTRNGDLARRRGGCRTGGAVPFRGRDQRVAHRQGARPRWPGARHWTTCPQVSRSGRRSCCARRSLCRPLGSPGLRWLASDSGPGHANPRCGRDCDAVPAGCSIWPRLRAVLDQPRAPRPGASLAASLARSFRPRRLADHLGVVAADAVASGAGCAHRDLDLPQSTTPVTPPPPGRPGAVWATAVRITAIRVAAITGAVWIADHWIPGTLWNRVRRRGTDRIRDWIASAT